MRIDLAESRAGQGTAKHYPSFPAAPTSSRPASPRSVCHAAANRPSPAASSASQFRSRKYRRPCPGIGASRTSRSGPSLVLCRPSSS